MRTPPAKRPRKRSKRGAMLLAIGVGLGGGLLLAGPLSELLSDTASGANNAITNPFAAWSGITTQDILLLGTDVGGGNTDVIASLRVDGASPGSPRYLVTPTSRQKATVPTKSTPSTASGAPICSNGNWPASWVDRSPTT